MASRKRLAIPALKPTLVYRQALDCIVYLLPWGAKPVCRCHPTRRSTENDSASQAQAGEEEKRTGRAGLANGKASWSRRIRRRQQTASTRVQRRAMHAKGNGSASGGGASNGVEFPS